MSTKLIIGCISGAGALGGAIAGSYYLLNEETEKSQEVADQPIKVKDKVTKNNKPLKELIVENFVALDTEGGEDNANWKKLIDKYNEDGTTGKISVDGITKETTDNNTTNIKKLQAACATLLAKIDDIVDGDKEIAKNWCNKNSTLIKAK